MSEKSSTTFLASSMPSSSSTNENAQGSADRTSTLAAAKKPQAVASGIGASTHLRSSHGSKSASSSTTKGPARQQPSGKAAQAQQSSVHPPLPAAAVGPTPSSSGGTKPEAAANSSSAGSAFGSPAAGGGGSRGSAAPGSAGPGSGHRGRFAAHGSGPHGSHGGRKGCRDLSEFTRQGKSIGQGTYGEVSKAVDPEGVLVALKRISLREASSIMTDQGFDMLALREIRILQTVRHKNIVNLKEVVSDKTTNGRANRGDVYMSLAFCEFDLDSIICNKDLVITPKHVQSYMYQILDGLQRLHSKRVLHRDLKPANILVTSDQVIKITDFGMSKIIPKADSKPLTTDASICTLWYRAPEIILGDRRYGDAFGASDVWSAGVLFAELLTGNRVTTCSKERDQLEWIFDVSGVPTEERWAAARSLPSWPVYSIVAAGKPQKCQVRARFADRIMRNMQNEALAEKAIDLLEKMLELDPAKRIKADHACNHDFFWMPGHIRPEPSQLPKFPIPEMHTQMHKELRAKQKRQMADLLSGGSFRGGSKGALAGAKRPYGSSSMPRPMGAGRGMASLGRSASRSPSAASAYANGNHGMAAGGGGGSGGDRRGAGGGLRVEAGEAAMKRARTVGGGRGRGGGWAGPGPRGRGGRGRGVRGRGVGRGRGRGRGLPPGIGATRSVSMSRDRGVPSGIGAARSGSRDRVRGIGAMGGGGRFGASQSLSMPRGSDDRSRSLSQSRGRDDSVPRPASMPVGAGGGQAASSSSSSSSRRGLPSSVGGAIQREVDGSSRQ